MKNRKKLLIKFAVSALTIVFMALVSELLGEPEIIFPEIAALAVGSFICDKIPWNVTPVKMFALMSLSAVVGYALALFTPVPIYLRLLAAFAVCMLLLSKLRCTMLPVISAALLPVLTSVQSLIYPISVLILTAMIIGIRALLEKYGLVSKIEYDDIMPERLPEATRITWLIAGFALIAGVAVLSGLTFIIAPPLAVIFAEAAYTDSPVHKSPIKFFLITALCAFTGTACRMICVDIFALPVTAGIFAAATSAIALLIIFARPFPPAAALAVLPFILPEQALFLYPFEVSAGALIFIAMDELYKLLYEKGILPAAAAEIADIIESMRIIPSEGRTAAVLEAAAEKLPHNDDTGSAMITEAEKEEPVPQDAENELEIPVPGAARPGSQEPEPRRREGFSLGRIKLFRTDSHAEENGGINEIYTGALTEADDDGAAAGKAEPEAEAHSAAEGKTDKPRIKNVRTRL